MRLKHQVAVLSSFLVWSKKNDISRTEVEPIKKNEENSIHPPNPIERSRTRIIDLMLLKGIPGLTICVSKQGKIIWQEAFGYCDVENQVACHKDAQMRIASISKSLFAATILAPMVEQGKLHFDTSVHDHLSPDEFPKQKFKEKQYDTTVGQLLSHTSGLRHYSPQKDDNKTLRPIGSKGSKLIYQSETQYNRKEFYQRNTYRDVLEALEPFKRDPLVAEPGNFKYTTYGYSVLCAVAQKVLQKEESHKSEQIEDYWIKILKSDWGMKNTYLDHDEIIIPKRARYYLRYGVNGELINSPYTDNSIKWAGGGIVSTTSDLVKFANQLLDCFDGQESSILKQQTINQFWKEIVNSYGYGFEILKSSKEDLIVRHTGSALGASSVLVIYPRTKVVVAILSNLGDVNLGPLGLFIAEEF